MTLLDDAPTTVRPAAAAPPSADRRAALLGGRAWQWLRYASVSLVSTAVGMIVLGTLVATRIVTPGWANVVATGVGTVPSFELNRRWVWGWRDRRSVPRQIGPFVALSFLGLLVSTIAVAVAGHVAAGFGAVDRTALIEAANVAAFGSLWVLQFLLCDRVLFARSPSVTPGALPAAGSQRIPPAG